MDIAHLLGHEIRHARMLQTGERLIRIDVLTQPDVDVFLETCGANTECGTEGDLHVGTEPAGDGEGKTRTTHHPLLSAHDLEMRQIAQPPPLVEAHAQPEQPISQDDHPPTRPHSPGRGTAHTPCNHRTCNPVW